MNEKDTRSLSLFFETFVLDFTGLKSKFTG